MLSSLNELKINKNVLRHEFNFQNSTLGYTTKTESDYFFFPPPKSEYFFQQHWESEYFFT
jgi:hypothetical protein